VKFGEKLLVVFAVILALVAGANYLTGGAFKQLVTPGDPTEKVGELTFKKEEVQRRRDREPDFRSINAPTPIFNLDTIVTADDGAAKITFEDGSVLELGPGTLIRIEYESQFSLSGISRVAAVNVVKGEISGQSTSATPRVVIKSREKTVPLAAVKEVVKAPPPTVEEIEKLPVAPPKLPVATPTPEATPTSIPEPEPSPTPTITPKMDYGIAVVSPIAKAKIEVTQPRADVVTTWTTEPKDLGVRWTLKSGSSVLKTEVVRSADGTASVEATLDRPGNYTYELVAEDPRVPDFALKRPVVVPFTVMKEFIGIQLLPPKIGGEELTSNLYRGKKLSEFDVELSWKPYEGVSKYRVELRPSEKAPLKELAASDTKITLNRDRVFTGQGLYRVKAPLKSGFIATSAVGQFGFSFGAPIPRSPANGASLSKDFLFSWHKTNFTERYEFEISGDAEFKSKTARRSAVENFVGLTGLRPGTYYWRVRAVTKDRTASPFSKVSRFEVVKPQAVQPGTPTVKPVPARSEPVAAPTEIPKPEATAIPSETRATETPQSAEPAPQAAPTEAVVLPRLPTPPAAPGELDEFGVPKN
jgi:hypothetical protein